MADPNSGLDNNLGHHSLEEQERLEILEEIDKVVETNRLPVSEDMARLTPQKKGLAFPLLINLFAVAAVLATIYFSNRMFEQKQEDLSLAASSYQSAEGKLLEELKKESEARLKEKDAEIGAIQDELAELDKQSRELAESMEQQIQDREDALRTALEQELEEERQKLRGQGRTEADIEEEIRRLEEERTAEYEAELAAFRDETQAAIAEKEEELARAKQLNEQLLSEVNSEKERIESETRQRESELTAQYEQEKAALAEETAAAEARLEQLKKNQAQQSLIIDQINGSYENIFELLDAGKTDAAAAAADALALMLSDPSVSALEAVSARSDMDREILSLIRERIDAASVKESADSGNLAAAADMLLSAQETARRGEAAFDEGSYGEASEYYRKALGQIPALEKAWNDLNAISAESERKRILPLLESASALAASGDYGGAASRYAEAASEADSGNPDLLSRAVSGLTESSETARASISSEGAAEIERLTAETAAELERLEAELAETRTEAERSLESAEAAHAGEVAELTGSWETRIEEADAKYTELEAAMNEEIDRLSRMIGERDQENLRLNTEKTDTETALGLAEEEITKNETELKEAGEKYQQLERTYETAVASASELLEAAESRAFESGVDKGRSEALNDILYFSSYLEGTAAYDEGARSRISELIDEDPAYGEAVRKIQNIAAAEGGEDKKMIAVEQKILLGTISFASGSKIIIEPLVEQTVETGTRVTIYRKERGKEEVYVTFGVVTSADASSITARTDPAGTEPAQSMDLVYMTVTE